VAVGCASWPLATVPGPESHSGRAALALLGVAALVGLLALLVREDEPRLWLEAADRPAGVGVAGGVLAPAATLERVAVEAVSGHPEVLRVAARAGGDARRPRLELRVTARPLVDESRVRGDAEHRAEAALRPLLGWREFEVSARVKAVPVRRMARYLP
jgi:hypothetical protein